MVEDLTKQKSSMAQKLKKFSHHLTRTKTPSNDVMETNLRRCLTTFDVTLLSLGHMVGSGVYVLTPSVAKDKAGPAIVISYLISGVASFLAALCYAELGVRYPRSGSAYSYTYLAVGELLAFLVGWNVALENTIAVAAVARSCSDYIDSLAGKVILNATTRWIGPMDNDVINQLDFLSVGIVLIVIVFLSFGVKMTSGLNNFLSIINIGTILLIIGVGAYYADTTKWTNTETGGFMPYGWTGVFAGSATCFYAYVGFDSIAASAEEANNPKRTIPVATIASMIIASILYIGASATLTLMVSYKDISQNSGFPDALTAHGAEWATIMVTIGAICGMSTGMIGSLFALSRVVYAMADDGLLFPICSKVNKKTQIPLGSLYMFGALAAIMTFMFEASVLAELLSIGTLFAYLVVSASIIVIRYKPSDNLHQQELLCNASIDTIEPNTLSFDGKTIDNGFQGKNNKFSVADLGTRNETNNDGFHETELKRYSTMTKPDYGGRLQVRFSFIERYVQWPPGHLVTLCVFLFIIFMFSIYIFLQVCYENISSGDWWALLVVAVLLFALISVLVIIMMHRQSTLKINYKVPLVPIFPALSILINGWLITNLQIETYIRLLVWVIIGLVIYFSYGIRRSTLRNSPSQLTLHCEEMTERPPHLN